jgi:hypothetical protein
MGGGASSVGVGGMGGWESSSYVSSGVGGMGGWGGVGGCASADGCGGTWTNSAVALLEHQLNNSTSAGPGAGSSSGGAEEDSSNDLVVMLSNRGLTCGAHDVLDGCDFWHVSLYLPPELQRPSITYALGSQVGVFVHFAKSGRDEGDCSGGGGNWLPGTVEIVSIDDDEVVIHLEGTANSGFNADGTYVAPRCP